MKTIYKYTLIEGVIEQELLVQKGVKILAVQAQHNQPRLWALVDPQEAETETLRLVTRGTGHRHDDWDNLKYLGSYQTERGTFVGHVFLNEGGQNDPNA